MPMVSCFVVEFQHLTQVHNSVLLRREAVQASAVFK